jgi:hypothetical protein
MPTNRQGSEMTMNRASEATYDLVLTGARICDPATGLDRNCHLAVNGDRIAAIGSGLASHARQVIELDDNLLTAGWVDLHVHVFEWMTTFGLPPDDAGVHSGVTTAVDQGGTGAYTIPAFKHYIADHALTDIRCFPSINSAGTLRGGLAGPIILPAYLRSGLDWRTRPGPELTPDGGQRMLPPRHGQVPPSVLVARLSPLALTA